MESALQVDLAKPEAPAEQVLSSALGQAAARPALENAASSNSLLQSREPRLSSKGGSATTTQVRLNAVAPKKPPVEPTQGQEPPARLLEFGKVDNEVTNVYTLHSVDGGFGAWSYVASAFAMYVVVWGFPQSFPIFQSYLSSGESAKYPDSVVLPLLAPGLQDIEEGLLFQLLPKSAKYRQAIVVVGIATMIIALLLASFALTAWQIVLTQGVLFGFGGILLNFVHVSVFSEWFDKKQGQAMGVIWLGFRLGGLSFPLICQWLLDKHGYPETLRVLIAPMLALLLPSIVLLRGRYSAAAVLSNPTNPPISKLAALKTPSLAFYLLVAVLFAFVTNVPMMFITKFSADVGIDTSDRALALSLVFLGNLLGPYVLGRLSDSAFKPSLLGISAILTSLIHFFIWGFAKTRFGIFSYAVLVGLTSGGFRNCLFSFYSSVSGKNGELFTTVHSLFSFFDGMAILSVGPVGTTLLKVSPEINRDAYGIGKYKALIGYAGGMSLTSGLLVLVPMGFRYLKIFLHRHSHHSPART